uniref:Endonuclease/exonuclease/phosphatase domain-containing protein n=1 Tax=Magallana gigas TaxID=29159 RepID=A0A8W8N2A0_MAGGI
MGRGIHVLVPLLLWVGLLTVRGDVSELDGLRDQPPIRIGAFNIQIFGKNKFNDPGVVPELVKILSRYDIVLVQEIRDSSETYIHKLVDVVNNSTRQDEPFSLVVSQRLGRSTSKEQYAYLYRQKYVNVVAQYQYEDTQDIFERPPYSVKFHSDVLEMHEFGIIGLHTKPDAAFTEIDALNVVYDEVEKRFGTPNILIAGDLNADCSYLSRTKMSALSIRQDSDYRWLINDSQDTTVGSTDCAYDRFIVKRNSSWLDNILPNSVHVFLYDDELQLTEDLAGSISDHYPIELQLRGKCNSYYSKSTTPLLTVTVEDERVIPSTDLSYIRYIYQKTDEKIPTWNTQVYKIDTRMNYVIATKANVDVTKVIEEFFQFYEAFDRKLLSLESIATLRKILDGFPCFRDPYIYCMETPSLSVVDLSVTCSLVNPLTCKMDVSRHLS